MTHHLKIARNVSANYVLKPFAKNPIEAKLASSMYVIICKNKLYNNYDTRIKENIITN